MSETTDVQALEKISTEVGDSQIKITLSSQCIKAQAFLVDRLRKQSERQKEICNLMSKDNLKLQVEIRQAEFEIKSLLEAKETIKSSNVELKKECLLLKERKSEIEDRIQDSEKKYEDLWLEAKARYESIPFVQKLLQAQNRTQTIKEDLSNLIHESEDLSKEIEKKRQFLANLNKQRIVELAQYIVHDLPKAKKTIQEKTQSICEIIKNIDEMVKKQESSLDNSKVKGTTTSIINPKEASVIENLNNAAEDGWFNFGQADKPHSLPMPQIQLIQSDFEALSAKLDKIKMNKIEIFNITPTKRADPIEPDTGIYNKKLKMDEEISKDFKGTVIEDRDYGDAKETEKQENYSKRKLINILEDIKLDNDDAYKIVSKVNPDTLKDVDKIGASINNKKQISNLRKVEFNEVIEEIDLTKSSENILVPPTQFLDFGEENNKKVCFDIPMKIQEINEENGNEGDPMVPIQVATNENDVNETFESEVDVNLVSNDSYNKMKDMILKKHNLDLSPQFVYAKRSANLQTAKQTDDKIVTSKFFQSDKPDTMAKNENMLEVTENSPQSGNASVHQKRNNEEQNMEVDEVVVSSPKAIQKQEKSYTGLLFKHDAQGIPDSLNVSVSTTGFEEGDPDFPHCIDSSLLLSPKADYPLPASGDNVEVSSQEVPNFLSGFRKTAFSFFGQSAVISDSKANTSEQNQNNFNFNFGGDEKRGRGGLFNMFH
ncbi:unnamed protein product [Diatraea saccharalis]|uniref:Uncharacterized protein n=1 Tax=Diatraea saccharalis TaxID=40085 RepID=A0A9N9WC20_9NEOP|nr:unnamed protein product [Diatraea saccharalis]